MSKILILLIALTTTLFALPGSMGFSVSLIGGLDFFGFNKTAVDNKANNGIGFGLDASPKIRWGSRFAVGPFAMFSQIQNSSVDTQTYFLAGYGGEAKLRLLFINFKGGYGLYTMKEKNGTSETNYTDASGWHVGAGLETLIGPGLTMSLEGKYRFINFTQDLAEASVSSIMLGVHSFF